MKIVVNNQYILHFLFLSQLIFKNYILQASLHLKKKACHDIKQTLLIIKEITLCILLIDVLTDNEHAKVEPGHSQRSV